MRFDIRDRDQFDAVLRHLGWPAATVDDRCIEGEAAWAKARPHLTTTERRTVLQSLGDSLLVAHPNSAARYERWKADDGPAIVLASGERRDYFRERVCFHGDGPLLNLVVEALLAVPMPVADAVCREAVILGVGVTCAGWTSSLHFHGDEETSDLHRIIVLSGRADRELVCHEFCHVWHAPLNSATPISTVAEERVRTYAKDAGLTGLLQRIETNSELLAQACAWLWSDSRA